MQKNGVWRCSLSVFQRENSDYFFAAFKVVLCNFYPALFENTLSEPTIRPSIYERKNLNYPIAIQYRHAEWSEPSLDAVYGLLLCLSLIVFSLFYRA